MNPDLAPKSPLKSKTLIGAIVLALAVALRHTGHSVSEDDTDLTNLVELSFDFIGLILVVVGRFTAKQPLAFRTGDGTTPLLLVCLLGLALGGCAALASASGSLAFRAGPDGKTITLGFSGK